MAKIKERKGRGEAYWRRIVRQQGASGLTVRQFCRQGDFRESTFYFWRRELLRRKAAHVSGVALAKPRPRGQDTAGPPAKAAFLPVCVTADNEEPAARAAAAGRIEIVLAGGRRIRVTAPVDCQALADVVAVLSLDPDAPRMEDRPC